MIPAAEPGRAAPASGQIAAMVRLARPYQWVKNGLIFAALIFARRLFFARDVALAVLAFIDFCALSSAAYVVNDILDRDADQHHPDKRNRPIASGEVSVDTAWKMAAVLGASSLVVAVGFGRGYLGIVAAYIVLQAAYSAWAKHHVVIDVIAIAVGFVLRAFAGGVAIGVPVSPWLVFITFVLALFLALARRRHELTSLGDAADSHRGALSYYSVRLIDQMISVVAGATLVGYMIYTASPEVAAKLHTPYLYLTVPFVAFGILRYLYLIEERDLGGDPAFVLLHDWPLIIAVCLWVLTDVLLLYLLATP
ncbi:MAG TPA: decaprenyl-phosphate phosphoribosyltransferase [Candidatus Binataceae bacterium]|nr:decaprenyl-phosphate phosphoribosyltransferase [Candidatus Binataceae bacterium]